MTWPTARRSPISTSLANKLVVNFVIQFKDEASAAAGYTSGTIFGIDKSTLKGAGAPVTEGTKTGLGANSIVLSATIANQSFYIAVWQDKAFMVILGLINLDTVSGQKWRTPRTSESTDVTGMNHPLAETAKCGNAAERGTDPPRGESLDHIRAAPADRGTVELIARRPAVDEREVLAEAWLDVRDGLAGDTWRVRGSSRTPDGGPIGMRS